MSQDSRNREMAASFEKPLTATDVNNRLLVPSAFLCHVNGGTGGRVEVVDEVTGKTYQLILQARAGKYRKPVFQSKGWQKLVKVKGLRVGDTIYFWKDSSRTSAENGHCVVFKIRALFDISLSTTFYDIIAK